jgi:hypothetical protein
MSDTPWYPPHIPTQLKLFALRERVDSWMILGRFWGDAELILRDSGCLWSIQDNSGASL